jgi:uroporphyrinogen decarboxylase
MTSREIVRKTLTFQRPERIAMSLPAPYPNDFQEAGIGEDPRHPQGRWTQVGECRWERADEWGNTWARIEQVTMGEVTRGVLQDWSQLDSIELPDYDLASRYEKARAVFAGCADKFRLGWLPGFPFSIARYMRRLDNFLVDVLAEPENTRRLLAMVEEQLHHAIRRFADAGADGVMFCEDWGTQDRLLVSPRVWRGMFGPGFQRLCTTARERGVFVLMHSCGCIREAMDDLVEAGIACFQFDQPALHGIEALSREFGGRVTFWCPVDIQATLQTRDTAKIRAAAREMIDRLGVGGGFIAGYYSSNDALGLDPKYQDAACRAFVEHGAPALWPDVCRQLPKA